jgi:carotenoid cleavage dioxygenase-like enzyme
MSYDLSPDFPAVNPNHAGSEVNDFWALGIGEFAGDGRKFFDELIHGSWEAGSVCDTYRVPRSEYLGGEPACAFNPNNPKEAVVMVQHFIPAESRAEYLLFDGFRLSGGPIARLPLRHMIHAGFHACFHFE